MTPCDSDTASTSRHTPFPGLQVFLEDAGFDWKILGPDVQNVDYVAWQCDQDAYACSGQKCSAQSMLFMHKNWAQAGASCQGSGLRSGHAVHKLGLGIGRCGLPRQCTVCWAYCHNLPREPGGRSQAGYLGSIECKYALPVSAAQAGGLCSGAGVRASCAWMVLGGPCLGRRISCCADVNPCERAQVGLAAHAVGAQGLGADDSSWPGQMHSVLSMIFRHRKQAGWSCAYCVFTVAGHRFCLARSAACMTCCCMQTTRAQADLLGAHLAGRLNL